jgi:DNA polymerase I
MNIYTDKAYKLFHDGTQALARMEQQGFRIDTEYIIRKKKEISKEILKLENEFKATKFYTEWQKINREKTNMYSPVQLSNFLYKVKKHKAHKETVTGQGATDEEALLQLNIPELNILLRIKKLKKMRDTYLDSFYREQIDGYIHPFYTLNFVKSFRGASDSPNWQNIPKRDKEAMDVCRKAIFPRPGNHLLELDYSQLEVRISACYTNDTQLIHDILHGDMHRDMAIEIFNIKKYDASEPTHKTLRQAAKNGFVFPQFYGDFYKNCMVNLAVLWGNLSKDKKWKKGQGIPFEQGHLSDHMIANGWNNLESFGEHLRKIEDKFWNERYRTYTKWKDKVWSDYQKTGKINSLSGFTYQGVMRRNEVMNYPIQGSAFHCLLYSIIEGTKAQITEKWKSKIIGQIHDAIIIDVHPSELDHVIKVMKCIMCNDVKQFYPWINVPLDIEAELCPVDASWAEKQEYKIY